MLPESIAVLRVTDGVASSNDVLDRVLGFREDLKAMVAGMPVGLCQIGRASCRERVLCVV